MGGWGSGRWDRRGKASITDHHLHLDVRKLARRGVLVPGSFSQTQWTFCGQLSGSISHLVWGNRIVLIYRARTHDAATWREMHEVVPLEYTSCHYGGNRPWFRCPSCTRRCAILYQGGLRFRCRVCCKLTYRSTRLDAMDRAHHRLHHLRVRLGADAHNWDLPGKPVGMHHRTYWRLVQEILAKEDSIVRLGSFQLDTLEESIFQSKDPQKRK